MEMVEPVVKALRSFEIYDLTYLEIAGRTCYKSESEYDINSATDFVRMIIRSGHHSVIEHVGATVLIRTGRGVTHELVRHRLASFSQESTRYVRYSDVEYCEPEWYSGMDQKLAKRMERFLTEAQNLYSYMLKAGYKPQQAREILPTMTKADIVVTANAREWRHILTLRASKQAHPEIRRIAKTILHMFFLACPPLFEDIYGIIYGIDIEDVRKLSDERILVLADGKTH